MGVKRGDVILAVNGRTIQSTAEAKAAYSEPKIQKVTIYRSKKAQVLTLNKEKK